MPLIKTIIFHLLLAIRGIILTISKLFAFIFLLCFILMIIVNDLQAAPIIAKIMALKFGIFFTLLNWFYDNLIFYFAPEDMELTLYR